VLVDESWTMGPKLAALAEQPLLLRGEISEKRPPRLARYERRRELPQLVAERRASRSSGLTKWSRRTVGLPLSASRENLRRL
jgi:hypothetical protein